MPALQSHSLSTLLEEKEMIQDNEVEDLELEEQNRVVEAAGMIDYLHFLEFKKNCTLGMVNYGDQFIKSLGITLEIASDKDAVKIMRVWQNECTQYEMIFRAYEAKRKALAEEYK